MQKLFFDFGRSYITSEEMHEIFFKKYPEEAKWAALADRERSFELNITFPNDAPWIEPVRNIPMPSSDELFDINKTALKAREESDVFALVAADSAYIAAKAALNFFGIPSASAMREVVFLGCKDDKTYHDNEIKKLAGKKFSVCIIDDGTFPQYAQSAAAEVCGLLQKEYGNEERLYKFVSSDSPGLKEKGGALFTTGPMFKGADAILSPGILFMLAACGIDINAIVDGAELDPLPDTNSFVPMTCGDIGISKDDFMPYLYLLIRHYSLLRQVLSKHGKKTEFFVWTDPRFESFTHWLTEVFKQYEHVTGLNVNVCDAANPDAVLRSDKSEVFITILLNSTPDSSGAAASKQIKDNFIAELRSFEIPILQFEALGLDPYVYGNFVGLFLRAARMAPQWKEE